MHPNYIYSTCLLVEGSSCVAPIMPRADLGSRFPGSPRPRWDRPAAEPPGRAGIAYYDIRCYDKL